jgi:hypothetical protein
MICHLLLLCEKLESESQLSRVALFLSRSARFSKKAVSISSDVISGALAKRIDHLLNDPSRTAWATGEADIKPAERCE